MSAPPARNVVIGLIAGSWIVNTVARAPGNSAPAARTAASAAAEPSNAISRLAAMARRRCMVGATIPGTTPAPAA